MNVNPYLFFNGRCEEAVHFYAAAVGGEVGIIYRQGTCLPPEGSLDAIQHTDVTLGGNIILQMSDCVSDEAAAITHSGFSVSLGVSSVEEARRLFEALLVGGTITVPFAPNFFSPGFGMLVDKFGVSWIITAASE